MFSFFKRGDKSMNIRKVSSDFSVTGQIGTNDLKAIAEAGYKSILCARPDGEEPGQPGFAELAEAARAVGLEAVHIPVSGMVGEGQIIRFHQAWDSLPRPMLGYCRSGARAATLHATLGR